MKHNTANNSVHIVNPDGLLPRGVSDFAELVRHQHCFVDKSLLIQEMLECGDKVVLVTRPRRFGKTINLSMLQHFFGPPRGFASMPFSRMKLAGHLQQDLDVAQNSPTGHPISQRRAQHQQSPLGTQCLFTDLLIAQDEQAMQHQGKYPVISLTFKGIKDATWQDAYVQLCELLRQELERHVVVNQADAACLLPSEQQALQCILQGSATSIQFKSTLKLLCKLLTLHHKQAPWLLLDEYDTPIHAAYVQSQQDQENIRDKTSYHSQMITFMRSLLGAALKGNDPFLHKAVITGILRVAKEDIFSDLNNLGVYGVMDWKFDRQFGFTHSEVETLLQKRSSQQHLPSAQHWYNGYTFGRETIYNPWSIVSFVSNLPQPAQEYWVNTGSTSLIGRLVETSNTWDKQAIATLLLNQTIERDVADNLPLRELQRFSEALWSIMLTSGYVTATHTTQGVIGKQATLRLPNQEVHIAFQRMAKSWFKEIPDNTPSCMLQALLTGDASTFSQHLNTLIACTFSFFDLGKTGSERSYHMFILGLLSHLSGNYKVRSNRESGKGRPDLLLIPTDPQEKYPGIVMEFKIANGEDQLQQAAQQALQQIEKKEYAVEFQDHPPPCILQLGIAFCNKKAAVASVSCTP